MSDVQTDPPPRGTLSESVNQWIIYDAYSAYEIAKSNEEEKEAQRELKEARTEKKNFQLPRSKDTVQQRAGDNRMLKAVKILERMVNQNEYDNIAQGRSRNQRKRRLNCSFVDFRFYEDAADEFKENEGTLLPLWKFMFENRHSMEITCLCWNPQYNDLFAAGFGSCKLVPYSFILKTACTPIFSTIQDRRTLQAIPNPW